jgi:hypothetical protein
MKKYHFLIAMVLILQACLPGQGLPFGDGVLPDTDTPAPSSTPTVTLTTTQTGTPTITPTITASPTIIRIPTQDPSLPTATFPPVPIIIGQDTATPFSLNLPGTPRPGPGFVSVSISVPRIYWGVCTPNRTVISAVVEDPQDVISVVIFVRVKSAEKEDYTPWTTGNVMYNNGDGSFTYTLHANTTKGHNHYKRSWVLFQLVATDIKGEEVGRTSIYQQAISMSPCMCLEPESGCPPTKKP